MSPVAGARKVKQSARATNETENYGVQFRQPQPNGD